MIKTHFLFSIELFWIFFFIKERTTILNSGIEEEYLEEDNEGIENPIENKNENQIEEEESWWIYDPKSGNKSLAFILETKNPTKQETKKKKKKNKNKNKNKIEKEIFPNKEISIIESNDTSIKNFLDFSPVHNSNLICWVKLKDDQKNLARSYARGQVLIDIDKNYKIFLNGKK